VPFLIFFETISVGECKNLEPAWERDFDYLRCQYNILSFEKFPEEVKEDISIPKDREAKKFNDLKRYLTKEKATLDKNLNDKAFGNKDMDYRPKFKGKSKSVEIIRKKLRRKKQNNTDQVQSKKNLENLSEAEILNRINFTLQLLKYSKSRGLNRLNIEYLEKLKEILSILKLKKLQRASLLKKHDNSFIEKCKQVRKDSPYEKFTSYQLRGYIMKAGDDMRQESVIIHIINTLAQIFKREGLRIFLRQLDFILLSKTSAMIEWIPSSHSIHSLKLIFNEKNLYNIYKTMFSNNFEEAQKNFVESLAGYSLVCYLLQIKDRHNSNILIDDEGHIIHIDFGFCLSVSPGNMGFETAPFKLTQEYIDIMGGFENPMFFYFKVLLFKGFEILKKFSEEIWYQVEIMKNAELPCFYKFDYQGFKERFHRFISEQEREKLVQDLITNSFKSNRTALYDQFQKYSNDIEI